jgi:pimeloyl-ACP methyl ester carboxylesterase
MQPHVDVQVRRSPLAVTILVLILAWAAGCATPVGVKQVGTKEAHQLLTASALSADTPSQYSLHVLSRNDLLAQFEDEPAAALAALHARLPSSTDDTQLNNRLFALAELSFLYAENQRPPLTQDSQCLAYKGRPCPQKQRLREAGNAQTYYLAAAVYAYAFLFPDDLQSAPLDPADPRLRLAYDLYNRGLTEGLATADDKEVILASGRYRLPFGVLDIKFVSADFTWGGYSLEHFVPTVDLAVRGLRNRYRRPGIGAPLAASLVQTTAAPAVSGANRIPPRLKVPVTAFLRLDASRRSLNTGTMRGQLELYAPDQVETITVNGHEQPLEFDSSAALAYTLEGSQVYAFELSGFLRDALKTYFPQLRTQDGLFFLHPPRPDRIPLVLVHGTASSPARWAELVNELEGDPRLRDRYQIWLFVYDTGNPIAYSAGRLRQALQHVVQELDPAGTAPALHRMVVIGHSQGGLLTKLTAIDSGTRFWDNISKVPFDDFAMEPETRQLLRQSLFVTPLPFVKRVVFISTPHRGSYLAGLRLGQLASWLVTLPGDLSQRTLTALTQNQDKLLVQGLQKLPTSIDNMNPSHPFIKTLATIPVAQGITAHSIIAVQGDGPIQSGGDGVVKYESAHIEGVESELVVRFGHSVQGHPKALEEVRRILIEHLNDPEGAQHGNR